MDFIHLLLSLKPLRNRPLLKRSLMVYWLAKEAEVKHIYLPDEDTVHPGKIVCCVVVKS